MEFKTWKEYNETFHEESTVDIVFDDSKIITLKSGQTLDIGKVGQVAKSAITNLLQTYKDYGVKIINDRYVMYKK